MIDGVFVRNIDSKEENVILELHGDRVEKVLDILVENCGRVNYCGFNSPLLNDQRKGKQSDFTLKLGSNRSLQLFRVERKCLC